MNDDGHSSKRARQSHDAQEHSEESNKRNIEAASVDSSSNQPVPARTGNSEAVYQLISMFAPLAAQGDRAAGSLQILSSSIAADLLAEVVMVNMQHLPGSHPIDQQQPPSSSHSSLSSKLPSGRFPLLESLWKVLSLADLLIFLDFCAFLFIECSIADNKRN
jgi:symplekin